MELNFAVMFYYSAYKCTALNANCTGFTFKTSKLQYNILYPV